jgi:hypothetical protein
MTNEEFSMAPRIRSLAPEAPAVFRDFVRQLERLAEPKRETPKPPRPGKPKAKPRPRARKRP